LGPGQHSDFVRDLRKILILTENECPVISPLITERHDIEGESHIDPFFLSDQGGNCAAPGQFYSLIPITQRTRVCGDSISPHLRQFGRPEVVPKGIVLCIGNSRVEADF